jgi:hypothetical protein
MVIWYSLERPPMIEISDTNDMDGPA